MDDSRILETNIFLEDGWFPNVGGWHPFHELDGKDPMIRLRHVTVFRGAFEQWKNPGLFRVENGDDILPWYVGIIITNRYKDPL